MNKRSLFIFFLAVGLIFTIAALPAHALLTITAGEYRFVVSTAYTQIVDPGNPAVSAEAFQGRQWGIGRINEIQKRNPTTGLFDVIWSPGLIIPEPPPGTTGRYINVVFGGLRYQVDQRPFNLGMAGGTNTPGVTYNVRTHPGPTPPLPAGTGLAHPDDYANNNAGPGKVFPSNIYFEDDPDIGPAYLKVYATTTDVFNADVALGIGGGGGTFGTFAPNTIAGTLIIDALFDPVALALGDGTALVNPFVDSDSISAGADGILGTADDTLAVMRTRGSSDIETEVLAFVQTTGSGAWDLLLNSNHPNFFGADGQINFTAKAMIGSPYLPPGPGQTAEPATRYGWDFRDVGQALVIGPCTGVIGDVVWHDKNQDGIQDAGEPGIDGVTVRLYDSGNNLIDTTSTGIGPLNQHGYYQFTGLCAGTYKVVVDESTLPPGYTATASNVGPDRAVDSNGSPATVTLPSDNSTDNTIDFGYVSPCTGVIGDFVWHDQTRNGVQDAGEPGIDGVTVYLYSGSNLIATTSTGVGPMSQHGYYQFAGLCAGTYTVVVDQNTLPAGYTPTTSNAPGSTPANDSNGSPATVTLPDDNSSDATIDFGYVSPCTGTIGDFIWHDLNRNGIQDAGEPGIDGVTVYLYSGSNLIATTSTVLGPMNQHGYYQFAGLCAGTYTVVVDQNTLPAGYTPTTSNAPGSTTANDSNGSPATVTLPDDNSSDATIDFGYVSPCTGTIGDFVWHDLNRNGIQDAGEPGIDGVTVGLYSGSDLIATATTGVGPLNQHGYYQFTGVCAGTYTVVVDQNTLPTGYTPTTSNAPGSTTANDSNGSPATVTLPDDNSSDATIDFGYVSPCTGTIGDFVWHDLNRNGFQDNSEPGINGVIVNLKDSTGTTVATTTTAVGPGGQNGYYQFTGLCAGSYTVDVVTPQGYQPTTPCSVNQTIPNDSNCIPAPVTLPADNSTNQTIDFGFVTPCMGSIGDFVWNDLNRNGLQDSGEPGIGGVVVNLKDSSGTIIATTTTTANGYYQFSGLCAGSYTVDVVTPQGYQPTTPCSVNQTIPNDSNCIPAPVTLPADNSTNQTIDFGFVTPCAGLIGDFVWYDKNGNGIQDVGEPGIASVKVMLKDGSGNVMATTLTNASGYYSFTGLCPGCYYVDVDESTVPAGYTPTLANQGTDDALDSDSVNGAQVQVCLTEGQQNTTVDFGFKSVCCTGMIGDFVWKDTNGNGIQDSGEPGIANVKVYLKDASGNVIGSTTTNFYGKYKFTGLCAGCYYVDVDESTVPSGYVPTTANAGSYDTKDSDSVNGAAVQVCLATSSSQDLTIDFGFKCAPVCSGVIGDFVWKDTNGNGIQDSGEPGIANVKVYLKDASGNIIATTLTDSCGKYKFTGLCAGCYYVDVDESTVPAGYTPTLANQGSNDALDSDSVNGAAVQVCLTANNSQNLTIDFGFKAPVVCTGVIGDFVWFDQNKNGIQDSGELGIANVKVILRDTSGNVVATTLTDSCGKYKFTGLCAGCYTVQIDSTTVPSGYTPTTANAGTNDAVDSDSVGGAAVQVCLTSTQLTDLTIDFGYKFSTAPPGCGTPGFWKNHPEAWPCTSITIGGKTYSRDQAIIIMSTPDSTDVTYTMFRALVAAKLNVMLGNDSSCISSYITKADQWLTTYKVGSGVSGSSKAWKIGEPYYLQLDKYNNGLLCAPYRLS